MVDRLFQPIINFCPAWLRRLPAIIGLFPLTVVCLILFVVLIRFLTNTNEEIAEARLLTWVMVVGGNSAMIALAIRLLQAQESGGNDRFRAGPLIRYSLLVAASCLTIISPGSPVAVLWLWWAAAGLMGCKAG